MTARMRLELGINVNLKLSQQLRLAPQIIQSIEILQLQAMDLKELIENELQDNEALEIVEPSADAIAEADANGKVEEDSFEADAARVLDRLDALLVEVRELGLVGEGGFERLRGLHQAQGLDAPGRPAGATRATEKLTQVAPEDPGVIPVLAGHAANLGTVNEGAEGAGAPQEEGFHATLALDGVFDRIQPL